MLSKLNHMSKNPKSGTNGYRPWFEQKEFLNFLEETSRGEIPLYIGYKGIFIYSVFLPRDCLKGSYVDDLMKWDCRPEASWAYRYSPGNRSLRNISSPYSRSRSKLLRRATPIILLRSFEGRTGPERSYIVANQLLTHPNDMHYENERHAYCRLNEDGEVEDVIRIHHQPGKTLVTMTQDVLDRHLFLTGTVLLRFFDRTISSGNAKASDGKRREAMLHDRRNKIHARRVIALGNDGLPTESVLRGFQIIQNRLSLKDIKLLQG